MNQEIIPSAFYTAAEVQEILKISKMTLWRYAKRGILPKLKLGGYAIRYRGADIIGLLEASKTECGEKGGAK